MDNSHVLSMLYPESQQRCDHPDSTRLTHNRCERRPHSPLRHCVPEVASKYASFSITSSVQLIASIGHISSSVQCCSHRTNGTKAGRSPSCDRDISSISHLSAPSQHCWYTDYRGSLKKLGRTWRVVDRSHAHERRYCVRYQASKFTCTRQNASMRPWTCCTQSYHYLTLDQKTAVHRIFISCSRHCS